MRRTLRPSRSLTTAVGIALLIALTACGGDTEQSGEEPASSSSGSTQSSPAGDQPGEGQDVEPSAFVEDMKAGLEASTTAKMTMSTEAAGAAIEAEGQVDHTTDPPSMAMTMTSAMMGEEPIDMRLVDGVMYMNMGKMSQGKFVAFDLSDGSKLPQGMSDLVDQMNPLAAFEDLEPAVKSVTSLGEEDVDGEQLAHYEVVLDPSKMTSLQGAPAAQLPDELVSDLWFDDQFRVRQMTMEMEMGQQSISTDVRFFDWDEPVEIEAPPAGKVVDPSRVAG